ncbi:MAG: carbamoyltransferase HypF [Eggerthellaceae bacterium]|nr:carbamoyltransferase HypF [Eggerthellaceae bacterium]
MIEALDIRVRGIVQGVGFRPFVYRLARRYIINGWVLNDLDGVFIHAEGEGQLLDGFVTELHMNPPAAARVTEVELKEVPLQDCTKFEIRESRTAEADEGTLVSADLATCDDCLAELFDPNDRRYRYPFINCTNCGPRFTIIDSLPYDRPSTSMAGFTMCPTCATEYADPMDRRFHAQPDACFDCGPHLAFYEKPSKSVTSGNEYSEGVWGMTRTESDAILARAVEILASGGILAVKGLGGFHLACDAANPEALATLRSRKRRGGQAFAVMVGSVDAVRDLCDVSAAEEAVMMSPARPIVLVRKKRDAQFAAGLADGLPELGVMLPATPLQHLLLHDFEKSCGRTMLVMTSGNVHDEPIVVDDEEALAKLGSIADAILGNDRPILSRYDDSVVRVLAFEGESGGASSSIPAREDGFDALQFIRRARGYAPVPIPLARATEGEETAGQKAQMPSVFAAGSEQKNTFAFVADGKAYVSQHIGDMEDADVYDAWLESKQRFEKLFSPAPCVLACDSHPEYLASKWARSQAFRESKPLTEVQHHHAHIASALGEHGLYGPCCGIAFDGTGYGADGAIWGGEVLLANQVDYERFANFAYMPMPGGAAAIKHPLRMAYGMLWAYDLLEHPAAAGVVEALGPVADVCGQMIESGLNTPLTSSVGRLFDAVSALLEICTEPTYEGEPAILLDAARVEAQRAGCAVSAEDARRYAVAVTKNAATQTSTAHDTSVVLFDAHQTISAVLDDITAGVSAGEISLRFHNAIVEAIVQVSELVRALYGIDLVTLSGGCFMNRYLVEQATVRLGAAGFTVALNASLPPNDGCISYGQAVVASASR